MLFNLLEYSDYLAFKRLVMINLRKDCKLTLMQKDHLIYLGTEHGICREDAEEIIDFCLSDYQHVISRNQERVLNY